MSKLICSSAISGAHQWVARAEAKLGEAIREKGEGCRVGFPDTAYYLPVIYSFTGEKVERLGDLAKVMVHARSLLPQVPAEKVWLPYLGNTLDAGVATLFALEAIEACKYVVGPDPVEGIWLGAASDVIMRERGVEFVDGTAPGFAAVTGAAPTGSVAVKIARELQEKNIYVFMAGSTNGGQFARQLEEEGVQLGWESRLVPFGPDVSALIYPMGFASRSCSPWAKWTRRSTPRRRALSTTASPSSRTPTSPRYCPRASAPTSTWCHPCPTSPWWRRPSR